MTFYGTNEASRLWARPMFEVTVLLTSQKQQGSICSWEHVVRLSPVGHSLEISARFLIG